MVLPSTAANSYFSLHVPIDVCSFHVSIDVRPIPFHHTSSSVFNFIIVSPSSPSLSLFFMAISSLSPMIILLFHDTLLVCSCHSLLLSPVPFRHSVLHPKGTMEWEVIHDYFPFPRAFSEFSVLIPDPCHPTQFYFSLIFLDIHVFLVCHPLYSLPFSFFDRPLPCSSLSLLPRPTFLLCFPLSPKPLPTFSIPVF